MVEMHLHSWGTPVTTMRTPLLKETPHGSLTERLVFKSNPNKVTHMPIIALIRT
jgi:hypothetical protein